LEHPSDEDLVAATAAGETTAFSALYDRYAGRVHAWAAHMLGTDRAEDTIQEIFLLLWRRAGQYDPERGSFGAWFWTLARHEIMHALRKRSGSERMAAAEEVERLFEHSGEAATDPADIAIARAVVPEVLVALRSMPAEQRQALVLAYFGGLSHSVIAERLGIPLGTVKKRIHLAMAKLRASVAGGGKDPAARESANQ
jgi:RNA polymerase sigma-70 factor (ECF subfamily)